MYLEKVPNRNSPPAILVRESYRQEGKVKKRTLANLSKLPPELIEQIGKILKGGKVIEEHILQKQGYEMKWQRQKA